MKALVAIKRVIDYRVKIRIKDDHSGVVTERQKMGMNPFCEIALEEAVRLKEQGQVDTVIAVTIGPKVCEDILRQALALGADEVVHVVSDTDLLPLNTAKVLAKIVQDKDAQLVITGKQSIDGDNNQTGQILASLLDWPQATFASKVVLEDNSIVVTREVDAGLQTIQCQLPAVVTTDLRLNKPRYAALPNIMRAKSKPIESIQLSELKLNLTDTLKIIKVEPPAVRTAGIQVNNVDELLDKLSQEAQVI